jgi:hypothetical protein
MLRGCSRTAFGFALGISLYALAGAASAATITFEGQFNAEYSSPITRGGFLIGNPVGQEQHFHEVTSTQFGLPNNGTGVLLNDRNTEIFVVEGSFADFTLSSVDVAAATAMAPPSDWKSADSSMMCWLERSASPVSAPAIRRCRAACSERSIASSSMASAARVASSSTTSS